MGKIKLLGFLATICSLFISCNSVQPMSESTKLFSQETELSTVVPLRFYTWIKVENAKNVQPDVFSGKLDFEYDGTGDFLLTTKVQEDKIISVWGKQLLLQNGICRNFIFTSFISSVYALENNKDPLDIAFEVLKQILADDAYKSYENDLINVFQEGVKNYRAGNNEWENYKSTYFIIEDKTIKIL
jgi:hypothetical protein